jgi:hypothetical protein
VTLLALVLAVVLAVGVVVVVALPFLREPQTDDDRLDAPSEEDERRLTLREERDRALSALKELEFDHRTGKITDEDYRRDVGPLRRAAAGALRRVEEGDAQPEREPRAAGKVRQWPPGSTPDPEKKESRLSQPQPIPEPAPPPDEGTPPMPAPVPEPYPPPDEGTPPSLPQE